MGPDFCTVLGTAALLSKGALEKGGLVFDLDDLDQHNFPTEHDGSLIHTLHLLSETSFFAQHPYPVKTPTLGTTTPSTRPSSRP